MSHAQLETLLAQQQYRQAIDEIKRLQRSQPDLVFTPSEAELWQLRGEQELTKNEFKAAENSFRQALKLGLVANYYWLAKAMLGQNRIDRAIELLRDAFDRQILPKDRAICYLKLLLINGDISTVESLTKTQAKRFSAAQLHWVRGVLALKSGDPTAALTSFNKLKQPLTPGDSIDAWITYTLQQQGNWNESSARVGLAELENTRTFSRAKFSTHPVLYKLAMLQQTITGNVQLELISANDKLFPEIFTALSVVNFMAKGEFIRAGDLLLKLKTSPRIAQLMALKSTVLTIAGEQARAKHDDSVLAVKLWLPLLQERELDLQLVVNFLSVLEEEDEHQERQRLLLRLIKWIEQDAKKNPHNWQDNRLKLIIAHTHCAIADSYVALNRPGAAHGAVQQGARICPTSPEVIGRQGIIASAEDDKIKGIDLMIQALDQGCQSLFVYEVLLGNLGEENRTTEAAEIRKRYGKKFGDHQIAEIEIKVEPWIDAISMQNYRYFTRSLADAKSTEPTIKACKVFTVAAYGDLTNTGKISIHQERVTNDWNDLLACLAPIDKISTLQAILLSIELYAKRDKGIAALSTRYLKQLLDLATDSIEAKAAYLVVLAVKERKLDKLQVPIKAYLAKATTPGNALALIQLKVRWFTETPILRSFIDTALVRESQNPLLLLAKATTFSIDSRTYQELRSQGFDLARRIQDERALQEFRIENCYSERQEMLYFLSENGEDESDEDDFEMGMSPEIEAFIEKMIRETIGKKMSRAELDRLMPILKLKFMEDMPGFMDDFDDEFIIPTNKKPKRGFMDL